MNICTRCPYNGTGSNECLKCKQDEQYSYKYSQYILDGYDAPSPDTSTSEKATSLPEEYEDKFRKALYSLFDLEYNQLMCLKAIMNGKSLVQFSKEMEKLAQSNTEFTRFRAFQTRKAIATKLGDEFAQALLTSGQRKELKANE